MAEAEISLKPRVVCHCANPQIQRYGDAIVCLRPNCLAACIWTISRRMGAAKFRVALIRRRGRDTWYDFCQFFAGWMWEHTIHNNHQGISAFSIADAAKSYLAHKHHDDMHKPSLELTTQIPWEFNFEMDDNGEWIIDQETAELANEESPYHNVLAQQVIDKIGDPVVCLFLADQITLADTALLLGKSVADTQDHVNACQAKVIP